MSSEGFMMRDDDQTMSSLRRRDMRWRLRRQVASADKENTMAIEVGNQEAPPKLESQTQSSTGTTKTTSMRSITSASSSATSVFLTTTLVITATESPQSSPEESTFSKALTRSTTVFTSTYLPTSSTKSRIKTSTLSTATATGILRVDPESINEATATPTPQTRAHKTLSHGATIGLEFLGITVGIIALISIGYLLFKRLTKLRVSPDDNGNPTPPPEKPPLPSSSSSNNNQTPDSISSRPPSPLYPATTSKPYPSYPKSNFSSTIRTQRLDRVRPDLLSPRELNGDIMRSHTRAISARTTNSQDVGPRKKSLKRDTNGRMVMRSGVPSSPTFHYRNDDREADVDDGRVQIEASGEWEDSRTVAGGGFSSSGGRGNGSNDALLKPLAGLMALPTLNSQGHGNGDGSGGGGGSSQDPTLMSGGLRSSTRALSALNGLDNRQTGVPYQSYPSSPRLKPQSQSQSQAQEEESGVFGRGYPNAYEGAYNQNGSNPFSELEGLRQAEMDDAQFEFERRRRERQSINSGTVRSTTSWNTGVWERLEKERVGLKGREVLEGGVGGGGVGGEGGMEREARSRESVATSVAVFRRPVSWVRDQVERNEGMRAQGSGVNREKAGMERLDG